MFFKEYHTASGLLHSSSPLIMGTRIDMLLLGSDRHTLETAADEAGEETERLSDRLNRFAWDSDIARINREASRTAIPLDEELWTILDDCRRYNLLTKGLFDITLSGFARQVVLDDSARTISFTSPDVHIDLGAYGKGYALLKIRQIFEKHGIRNALVNFGNSSVLGMGTHPHGSYWPVGLENPYTKEEIRVMPLCDTSMSTSGNTPGHPQHIMNPSTGEFCTDRKMVSVITGNPVEAEVWSTALMIATPAQWDAFSHSTCFSNNNISINIELL